MKETTESPVLCLPNNPTLRKSLELKLKEYQRRKIGKEMPWEYMHPHVAFISCEGYRHAYYKEAVLSTVLKSQEPVKTFDLALKLRELDGRYFDEGIFNNACAVIEMYLTDVATATGVVKSSGTGLPIPEPIHQS